MLRLQRMQIVGFKSFSDRAELVFPDGITAVVGPNGCGKSNIGDALNWVLGEQSARMLRGGSMQDVIFNGSEARRPVGMAEVSLHLSGVPDEETAAGGGPREVVLTRRLYRSGESDYLVNGSKARLKDIQDLLREARVGTKTYATIEQGRIDQILNAKPKERRLLIEEAAGVSGFKHKRRLAELKLEATQANLLRVQDVIGEVTRQINSLKRQAAKARRYARLREELRGTERVRFGLRAAALDAALAAAREAEQAAREGEGAAAAALAAAEAGLEEARAALDEVDRTSRETSEAYGRVRLDAEREESRATACRERIAEAEAQAGRLREEVEGLLARGAALEAEAAAHQEAVDAGRAGLAEAEEVLAARSATLDETAREHDALRAAVEARRRTLVEAVSRAADARNRLRQIEEALVRATARAGRLEIEAAEARGDLDRLTEHADRAGREHGDAATTVERLEGELRGLEEALRAARSALEARLRELNAAREREKSAAARLRTLEDVATRFAGVSDGVRMLLAAAPASGVRTLGVMADHLQAAPEAERAADAYLQGVLPAVILEDDGDACRAVEMLRAQGAGRTHLVCRSQPIGAPAVGAPSNGHRPYPEALLSDARVIGALRDRLRLNPGVNGYVQGRIGDALLVDTLDSALALHREHPHLDFLTADGTVVYASGMIAAGGGRADHGLLAHNRRTQEARAELHQASIAASAAEAAASAARSEVARLESELAAARGALEEARGRRAEVTLRAERSRDERDRGVRRAAVLAQELDSLREEMARQEADREAAGDEARRAGEAQAELEAILADEGARLDVLAGTLRALSGEAGGLRADLEARRQRQAAAERDRDRARAARAEAEARLAAVRGEIAACEARAGEAAEARAAAEEALVGLLAERERLARESAELERRLAEGRAALSEREAGLRGLRGALETAREAVRDAEIRRARAESDRAHLDDLCSQELGVSAAQAAAEAGEALAGADPEAVEREAAELRRKIEEVGPVNMTAIEEFAGLEERHAFLTRQKDDLDASMASLKETIRRINRSSRERFQDAFDKIRHNYQEIFRTLFNGGRADLSLEEGEDVLECGIEILAQPPGKRLGSVSLLSGGEKAMAAIALLFAIFRYQPSPFCLLDEVDAALDDLNVGRFTRMLREYAGQTQFILVTHNKRSMEAANVLYGVTMEEPGVSKLMSLRIA